MLSRLLRRSGSGLSSQGSGSSLAQSAERSSHGSSVHIVFQGWLSYLGEGSVPFSKAYRQRWFILWSNCAIDYYVKQPIGDLKYATSEAVGRFGLNEHARIASTMSRSRGFGFTIEALGETFVMEAASSAERDSWIIALEKQRREARYMPPINGRKEQFTDDGGTADLPDHQLSLLDPRWDRVGFEAWIASSAPFLRVGYLRQLLQSWLLQSDQTDLQVAPATEFVRDIPTHAGVTGINLFAVLSGSLMIERTDSTSELQLIIEVLDSVGRGAGASNDDLIFWDRLCVAHDDCAARDGMFRLFTHFRVQTIVLAGGKPSIFDRLEPSAYLALVAFCQRIVNASDPLVQAGLQLERLMDLPNTLASLQCDSYRDYQRVAHMLEAVIRALTPVATDEEGFQIFCGESNITWLRATYVRELAARGGPCPRRQDLPPDGIIVGRLPRGRKISVSHGWDSAYHISPTGEKLRLLARALDELGVNDPEDGVFLDYTSLPQRGNDSMPSLYSELNSIDGPLRDRTPEESQQFTFALWEMSRMYSYKEMEVIVLPQSTDPSSFPVGREAWGAVNPSSYESRGWCTSEYAIARFNGRIANAADPAVKRVDTIRVWPNTISEYSAMMDSSAAKQVLFTQSGDSSIVIFLFFRICFGMIHSFFPADEALERTTGYDLPPTRALSAAEHLPIGSGNQSDEYYLYIAIEPPALTYSDHRQHHSDLLHALQIVFLAKQEAYHTRKQFPIGIGDATCARIERSLANGRIRALLWSAPGCGWRCDGGRSGHISLNSLCQAVARGAASQTPQDRSPAIVFVCLEFGAQRAASQLFAQCTSVIVVWIEADLLNPEHCVGVVHGLVMPLLEMMHQPRMRSVNAEEISAAAVQLGRLIFGSGWHSSGCFLPPIEQESFALPFPSWTPQTTEAVWLHSLPQHSTPSVRARLSGVELQETLKLTVSAAALKGLDIDVMQRFGADATRSWLSAALPLRNMNLIASLFSDGTILYVKLVIESVGALHELRDSILTGDFEAILANSPLSDVKVRVRVDTSAFVRGYEVSILALEHLTPHQLEKMQQCLTDSWATCVHLKAPAGAGKTFVALHIILELLLSNNDAYVLFVAQNKALCVFIIRWIWTRVRNPLQRLAVIRRVHLLFHPFTAGPQSVSLLTGQIDTAEAETVSYSQVVVDEAHFIYRFPDTRKAIEKHVKSPSSSQKLLLLSDVSQSSGHEIAFPSGNFKEVILSEVVRSSQRIISAASAFQIGSDKQQVVCHHNASGPPVKSFLFDLTEGPVVPTYAQQTVCALQHVIDRFGEITLSNRLAIVVKDAEFALQFRQALAVELKRAVTRPFLLIDAVTATAQLSSHHSVVETIVVDSVSAFDGLERLIVIAVGLDANIDDSTGNSTLETRSLLYRALTRAQMMAVVVDQFLAEGYLAFLSKLSLRSDAMFDAKEALAQQNTLAVEEVVERAIQAEASAVNAASASPQPPPRPTSSQAPAPTPPTPLIMQGIWDTGDNSATRATAIPKFMPFQVPLLSPEAQAVAILTGFADPSIKEIRKEHIQHQPLSSGELLWFVGLNGEGRSTEKITPMRPNRTAVANLRVGAAFFLQLGFQNYYWNSGAWRVLGPPKGNEKGGPTPKGGGSMQLCEYGAMYWADGHGMWHDTS